jgi:hypothetical protein
MFLTSPYIDQAISLKSPPGIQMSVIAMFRHLDLAFWRAENHLRSQPSSFTRKKQVQPLGRIAGTKERHVGLLH